MASSKKRKLFRYFLLIFWVSVFGWQLYQMNAKGFDKTDILSSNQNIVFTDTDDYLSYVPKVDSTKVSLLFFPGALVQPEAYAPLLRDLAMKGYSSYIQKIPFRIAITDNMEEKALDEASSKINSSNDTKWIIMGHSRGGRMAANYSAKYPHSISGLILMGTTHPKEKDLTNLEFPVLKISASEDGLASPNEINQFAYNLPSNTEFIMIEGANHSQFGYYGFQFGAGKATLTREEQQKIAQREIIAFLNSN
jgi:alpha-beta hydrolase superfamily lysophospholipase